MYTHSHLRTIHGLTYFLFFILSEPHTEPISEWPPTREAVSSDCYILCTFVGLERFKPLLKKKEIAKDPDLVLKVFNVLANKHTHIQPQLFHEFCENWQNHEAKRRQFVPPNFPLAKKTKTECKEVVHHSIFITFIATFFFYLCTFL